MVDSKAWGIPGYLIQSDLLTPMAPLLSARGDSFTVRSYGEAVVDGKVMARAYLEAHVIRSAEYVVHEDNASAVVGSGNRATDVAIKVSTATGEMKHVELHEANAKYGRRFIVTQTRWLNENEI